jgi:sec-independent protein translocase protein TatC
VPAIVSLFVAAPWILYQVWAFIAPGLYKKERKWAVPFVLCTAGLFIGGGCFAYFVAFRFGLTFLLQLMLVGNVNPMITITSYFDLFMNVMLGVAIVFELPVVIFFLILLRITTPKWLMANSRYAILGIVILAAIVTPTPDALNMMLFAVPMLALYFFGVFAGYLLVLRREGQRFPWLPFLIWTGVLLLILGGALYWSILHYHLHWIKHWPFLIKPHP